MPPETMHVATHPEVAIRARPHSLPAVEPVDARVVALMRCLLATAALFIVNVNPQSGQDAALYASILGYGFYSGAAFLLLTFQRFSLVPARAQHWVDVAFFVLLVGLTSGGASAFYPFFFFSILAASFSRGALEGFTVTLVSVVLYTVVGVMAAPAWLHFEFDRAVLLALVGYVISYWGGHEFALRRRLHLSREISSVATPQQELDHAAARALRLLLEFFDAQGSLLVFPKPGGRTRLIYRVDRSRGFAEFPPDEVSDELARPLLSLEPTVHVSLDLRGAVLRFLAWQDGDRCTRGTKVQCVELAELLEARSFASVPYRQADGTFGRLYLIDPRRRLDHADTAFLAQVVNQMASALSNVMLLGELAGRAAQLERAKISRDIHDTNLQAYIGLKLGLEALRRDLEGESPTACARVGELLDMATLTVDDLRSYVRRLRTPNTAPADDQLEMSLNEQARRYRDYHGIDVSLNCDAPAHLNERIGAEASKIVSEALSNVLRHTTAKQAYVDVRYDAGSLAIEVGSAAPANRPTPAFVPRSITERTIALGGKVQVRLNKDGHDVVRATIPLLADLQAARSGRSPRAVA